MVYGDERDRPARFLIVPEEIVAESKRRVIAGAGRPVCGRSVGNAECALFFDVRREMRTRPCEHTAARVGIPERSDGVGYGTHRVYFSEGAIDVRLR